MPFFQECSLIIIIGTIFLCPNKSYSSVTTVNWSTWDEWHSDYTSGSGSDSSVSGLIATLKGLNASGTSATALHGDDGNNNTYDGDLIELGFFDLDTNPNDTVWTPNTSTTNLFRGTWTALTTLTTIGQDNAIKLGTFLDPPTSFSVGDGNFSFQTTFDNIDTGSGEDTVAFSNTNVNSGAINSDAPTNLADIIDDLDAASSPLIGLRFYDVNTAGDPPSPNDNTAHTLNNGTTRYNTIMDANWVWQDGGSVNILLRDTGGSVNSSVQFEFDNSDYNSLSDIGTGGSNAVGTDDYVATVTYFSGSGVLNLDNDGIGDTVLSGLDSTGTQALGQIQVGNDNNILTINAGSGSSYDFNGTIQASGGGAGQASILKTGAGEQILTGAVNLDGTSSGFVDVYEGTLTFNPDSADTQSIEYLTSTDDSDAGTTPVLKLDNTSAGTGEILEIGLSNVSSAKTFNGNIVLSGADSDHRIKIGTTNYTDEQIITGTISSGSNGMTLVKDGAGRLTLHGDSDSTMGAGITIDDGTLIIGDGSDGGADPGAGKITINKGKLEVAANEIIDNNISGGTNTSKKSMLGGDGTFSYNTGDGIVVGSGSEEIDVISPGQGLSSSLTEMAGLSNQQVTLGTSSAAEAMGNLTITSLTLNNGAIFDWEISDFNSGANQASFNNEFDVLNFGTLNFGSGAVIDVNIFSVQSNGTAGAVANIGTHSNDNGILFLNGGSHSDINWGSGNTALSNSGWSSASDYFSVDEQAFNYYNGNLMGDWNVWYNGSGDFYLRYTAAPEPSTYVMITGLLMLPGFRMFRRFFKKAKPENSSNDS